MKNKKDKNAFFSKMGLKQGLKTEKGILDSLALFLGALSIDVKYLYIDAEVSIAIITPWIFQICHCWLCKASQITWIFSYGTENKISHACNLQSWS